MGEDDYDSAEELLREWAGPSGGGHGTAAATNARAVLYELDVARARVAVALALHSRRVMTVPWPEEFPTCVGCDEPYPCSTRRTLDIVPTRKDPWRVAELEAENERLRLHEQAVLALIERAERGSGPLDPTKVRRALDALPAVEATSRERARPVPLPGPNTVPHTDGWVLRDAAPVVHEVTVRPMTDAEIRAERLTQPAGHPWLARCTCGAEMLPLYPGEANAWEQGHLGTRPQRAW